MEIDTDKLWRRGVERSLARVERDRGAEWYGYHLDEAERLRRTMEPLIAFHEARAQELMEGGA